MPAPALLCEPPDRLCRCNYIASRATAAITSESAISTMPMVRTRTAGRLLGIHAEPTLNGSTDEGSRVIFAVTRS